MSAARASEQAGVPTGRHVALAMLNSKNEFGPGTEVHQVLMKHMRKNVGAISEHYGKVGVYAYAL